MTAIGVAYDGSEEAKAALATAAGLAQKLNARIEVIGVLAPDVYDTPEEVAQAVQLSLDTAVRTLPSNVKATTVRLEGAAAEALAIHSAKLDLLVTGSRGYGPIRYAIVGGVNGHLARTARCPVVVIPPGLRSFSGATLWPTPTGQHSSVTTIKDMTISEEQTTTTGQPGPIGFARMAGSSIAGRDAAPWITDFLNAAYYRREPGEREVDDLRFAFSVLTTYWYRKDPTRKLRVTDLPAFHRAFGSERFAAGGRLSREALERGAATLLGDWFGAAYADPTRKGWGIAFETEADKAAYDPDHRFQLAKVGDLTAESAPLDQQVWHTYDPVEVPSAEGLIAAITQPETWPEYASEIGRFTPLRKGGLLGQTFEIEVAAATKTAVPVYTRGYVTITTLVTPDDPKALHNWFEALEAGMKEHGEPPIVPEGGEPLVGFDLTTHAGHFMGSGHNRLVLYTLDGKAYVRAAGTWDPMAWHLDKAYKSAGKDAQHAFWGVGNDPELSMLHQIALALTVGAK